MLMFNECIIGIILSCRSDFSWVAKYNNIELPFVYRYMLYKRWYRILDLSNFVDGARLIKEKLFKMEFSFYIINIFLFLLFACNIDAESYCNPTNQKYKLWKCEGSTAVLNEDTFRQVCSFINPISLMFRNLII